MENLFLFLFFASLVGLIIGFIKPTVFFRILKERATRKNSAKIFGVATIIFFILFAIATDMSNSLIENEDNQISQKSKQMNEQKVIAQGDSVAYEIVEVDDQSLKALGEKNLSEYTSQELAVLPINKKMSYRIVVPLEIKENQVKPTIEKIISDITSKNNNIDEIILWLYSDKKLINGAYDVATAIWAPNGQLGNITSKIAKNNIRDSYKISIQVKENLEEYLIQRNKSEDKFGLTEDQRRQIFKDIVAAENQAMLEADKIFPIDISDPNYKQDNLMKNIDKNNELMEKYKAQVRAKYEITEEIENEIVVEAFEEGWPLK